MVVRDGAVYRAFRRLRLRFTTLVDTSYCSVATPNRVSVGSLGVLEYTINNQVLHIQGGVVILFKYRDGLPLSAHAKKTPLPRTRSNND